MELGPPKVFRTAIRRRVVVAFSENDGPFDVGGDALDLEDDALEVEDDALEVEDDALEVEDDALEVEDGALEVEDDALEVEDDALEVEDGALEVGAPVFIESDGVLDVGRMLLDVRTEQLCLFMRV